MKKVALFSVIIVMITFSISHAAIITVDNKTPSIGDYTTLQAAHDAGSDGDIIYVCPSGAAYHAITVTKRLTFVGTGLDYPSEGMNTTLISGTMTFGSDSDGSSLEGFCGSGEFFIIVDADNITIKRNKIECIKVNQNHTGTVILQNFLYEGWPNSISPDHYLIEVEDSNEVLIANNKLFHRYCCLGKGIKASSPTITITIIHNVITICYHSSYALSLDNSNRFVANNIIVNGECTGTSGYFYNMHNLNYLPNGNGNIENVDMNTVFADFHSPDGNNYFVYDFHLLSDSPAIGAGQNGVDMGIYGGSTPFVDGGAPSLPSIFYLESDHVGSQQSGLDVTIKAKSNMQ